MDARVLLVGYGSAGRGIHAPLLTAAGAPPAVVVTGNPERAAQARADLPGVTVVPTLDDGLAAVSAGDAGRPLAVVASATGAHAEQALACLAAGVAVVVDKPLAVDGPSARAVVAASRAAGVPLTVFQNRRWDDESRTLAALLAQGALGEVLRFERRWERWRPVPKDRWRENADWRHGGGALLDLGPHLVDSAVVHLGPVTSVHAELESRTTAAEDDVFVSLQHEGGARSHLSATPLAAAPGPRTRVLGRAASYVVTSFESEPFAFGGFDDVPGHTGWLVTAPDERRPVPTAPGGHADFYRAVLAALTVPDPDGAQAAMPVQPGDAVAVAQVIDAARLSAQQGRVVPLPPAG